MKLIKATTPLALGALAFAAIQLYTPTSVAAAGYKLADKTGASIAEFRDEILNVKKQVDATMAALGKVSAQASVDPRKAFNEFNKSLPRVEDAANKAKKRAEAMKARGQQYFAEWEKELASVSNPDIRKLAEERKAKLQEAFGSIKSVMEPARDQFNAWVADLKDLDKYFGNDLTISGIAAAKDLITKATSEGQAVQLSLDKVIADLNTVVATVTPAKEKK
jgi:hypothetical protein